MNGVCVDHSDFCDGLRVSGWTCPICGRDSVYVRCLDRYIHEDGTANDDCWLRILRGEYDDVFRDPHGEGERHERTCPWLDQLEGTPAMT